MFNFKNKKRKDILSKLKNRYLFGVDVSNGYLELITYNLKTKQKESDFYENVDFELIDYLHERRRLDTLKCFDKIYNDITINEIKEPNSAYISFINEANKYKVEYYVSSNLVRKKEEIDFISEYINLYSLDKKVYSIDDKIIDITTNPPVIKSSNIIFLDEENYAKELHLNGKFICSNELPGIKEMKDIQISRKKV